MIFTSFGFLIFFPVLALIYYITPVGYRWLTLLLASYAFYINLKPVFAFLLAGVTLSTYFFTRLINKSSSEPKRKTFMFANIVLVLLPLFFFKYFRSINALMVSLFRSIHIGWPLPEIRLILPVGISFYTFVAVGYTVDVYNGEVEFENNLGILALFLSFFPLILSGPIERAKNLLPQFKAQKKTDYGMMAKGLKLMLWGYFMKLVVADRIGIYVDAVYENIAQHNGTTLLFASFLYPFQVYADLGGYSLIAIGTAKILGINVMQNFRRPFFATSMSEFWRRWHISLISWLTDYVYTPLAFAFRKYRVWGIVIALMITFLISGIWHGAGMTFIVWGLMQGVFLSIEALTNKKKAIFEKKHKLSKNGWYIFAGISLTFTLFAASEIVDRAASIQDALMVYHKIFSTRGPLFIGDPACLMYSLLSLLILMLKDFTDQFTPSRFLLFENKRKFIRVLAYSSIVMLILLIGVLDGSQFIYFQF